MSGLFKRARAYNTKVELLGETMSREDFVLDIPADERESVLVGIDTMLLDERILPDESELTLAPRRHAFALPLLLNIGAVVVLLVGAFILLRTFERGEVEALGAGGALVSAEGRILDRLRRESEAELGAKDQEIADIRSLLVDLENQRNLLTAESEAEKAELEATLRHQFEADLAAEQVRLTGEGLAGADLSAAMAVYEDSVREDLESRIAESRAATDAEQQRRLAELDAQKLRYENEMAAVDADRVRIAGELADRDAEISRLEEEQRSEAALAGEASRQLSELREARARERLVTDQILAFYRQVGFARSTGDIDGALSTLDSLEQYLAEDGIRSTSVVSDRLDVDNFLIAALRNLVVLDSEPGSEASAAVNASALTLSSIVDGAATGVQLAEAGDLTAARNVWQDAFSALPELEEAFDIALENADTAGTAELTAADLSGAREAGFAAGLVQGRAEVEETVATEIESARRQGFDSGLLAGIEQEQNESGPVIARLESLLASVRTGLEEISSNYSTKVRNEDSAAQESRDRMLALLDAKLVIKSDLDPSMHDELDEYTEASASHREEEVRNEIYSEILGFLSRISTELDPE